MICGNCGTQTEKIDLVRKCYQQAVGNCPDLMDTHTYDEDGQKVIVECRAHAWYDTEGNSFCERGHSNYTLEHQWKNGWAYVTEDEAAGFVKDTGREAVLMDGKVWLG